jgi:hypothetical protein
MVKNFIFLLKTSNSMLNTFPLSFCHRKVNKPFYPISNCAIITSENRNTPLA